MIYEEVILWKIKVIFSLKKGLLVIIKLKNSNTRHLGITAPGGFTNKLKFQDGASPKHLQNEDWQAG